MSTRTERVMTVNGRLAPVEQVEEKVIKDDSTGRIVERTIRRFGQDGRPGPAEKVRIETKAEPGGQETSITTISDADINGSFRVRERRSKRSTTRGSVTDSTTEVERPALDNSLRIAERHVARETAGDNGSQSELTVYSRTQSGRFEPTAQEMTETVRQGTVETRTVTRYDTVNNTSEMAFTTQSVIETDTKPDGSQTIVINNYGAASPGRSTSVSNQEPQLREQEIIERSVRGDGSVLEVTGVRRVELSDAGRLGPYQRVSEVICTGNCLEPADSGEESQKEEPTETAKN